MWPLPPKAVSVPELGMQLNFWVQNQWPSSWSSALAQPWEVRNLTERQSTNTGCFQLGDCYRQQPLYFSKKCSHWTLCIDLQYWLSWVKKFKCFVIFGKRQPMYFFKAADLDQLPVQEQDVCSNFMWRDCVVHCAKAGISGMNLNQWQPKFACRTDANEMHWGQVDRKAEEAM